MLMRCSCMRDHTLMMIAITVGTNQIGALKIASARKIGDVMRMAKKRDHSAKNLKEYIEMRVH